MKQRLIFGTNKEMKNMKYCPKCGKTFNDQTNYCEGCGSPLYVKQVTVGSGAVTDNSISANVKTSGLVGAIITVISVFLPMYRERYNTLLSRVDETYTISDVAGMFVPLLVVFLVGLVMYYMFFDQRKNYLIYCTLLCILLFIIGLGFAILFGAIQDEQIKLGYYMLVVGTAIFASTIVELVKKSL